MMTNTSIAILLAIAFATANAVPYSIDEIFAETDSGEMNNLVRRDVGMEKPSSGYPSGSGYPTGSGYPSESGYPSSNSKPSNNANGPAQGGYPGSNFYGGYPTQGQGGYPNQGGYNQNYPPPQGGYPNQGYSQNYPSPQGGYSNQGYNQHGPSTQKPTIKDQITNFAKNLAKQVLTQAIIDKVSGRT